MGFSIRKRTKGKSSWLNLSASKNRGLHSSYSLKLGKNTTLNFSKNGNRVTHNFGYGVRWTSSLSKKKSSSNIRNDFYTQEKQTKQDVESNTDYTPAQFFICAIIAIIVVLIELYIKGS